MSDKGDFGFPGVYLENYHNNLIRFLSRGIAVTNEVPEARELTAFHLVNHLKFLHEEGKIGQDTESLEQYLAEKIREVERREEETREFE